MFQVLYLALIIQTSVWSLTAVGRTTSNYSVTRNTEDLEGTAV